MDANAGMLVAFSPRPTCEKRSSSLASTRVEALTQPPTASMAPCWRIHRRHTWSQRGRETVAAMRGALRAFRARARSGSVASVASAITALSPPARSILRQRVSSTSDISKCASFTVRFFASASKKVSIVFSGRNSIWKSRFRMDQCRSAFALWYIHNASLCFFHSGRLDRR